MRFSNRTPATLATFATQPAPDSGEIHTETPATFATFATQAPPVMESSRSSRSSSTPESKNTPDFGESSRSSRSSSTASPIWIIRFPDGRHYQTEFDPPITMVALLEKWAARHPNQPITATLPIPVGLWAAMELAAGRNAWCEETWPMQLELILDALTSGRTTVAELTASYSTPPPGYESPPVDTRKPEILNAIGIDRYESKPVPAFTLSTQSAPELSLIHISEPTRPY